MGNGACRTERAVQLDDPKEDVQSHDAEVALVLLVGRGGEKELDEGGEVRSEEGSVLQVEVSERFSCDVAPKLTERVKPSRTSKTDLAPASSLASSVCDTTWTIPGTRAWKAALRSEHQLSSPPPRCTLRIQLTISGSSPTSINSETFPKALTVHTLTPMLSSPSSFWNSSKSCGTFPAMVPPGLEGVMMMVSTRT